MNIQKIIIVCLLANITNISEFKSVIAERNNAIQPIEQYHSIEGIWKCTPETAFTFSHGALEYGFRIACDSSGQFIVNGFQLWDDEYKEKWQLVDCQYNEQARLLTMPDADGNIFKGTLDKNDSTITGYIHAKNTNQDVALNLVRADKKLEIALFYPRLPDANGNVSYSYHTPEQIDDDLQTASITEAGVNTESIGYLLQDIINQDYGRLESLLISKDGQLLLEEYFYGYDRTRLHRINSCTKSVTSLLLGIAKERHHEFSIEQKLFDFFPQYDSLKTKENERITIENVLTMTSGFQWHEIPKEMYISDNRIEYILSRPMETPPGKKFLYNSGGTQLIGTVLMSLEGPDILYFADSSLFEPLGITDYVWDIYKNGALEYWRGLHMRPRDMAKLGQLVLNNGVWNGKQIVPSAWIQESTKPRVAESKYFRYGLHWWYRDKDCIPWWKPSNEDSSKQHDLIVALGFGGNYIIIIRDLNLVVVTTASDNDNDNNGLKKVPMVIERIIPLFAD
ncbi:serine hydrolase [candidate division KSB1 bacterium]|nr:serine hydrolase [candidate division KSB1 bacterium]